jgi:hypothetical protein
MDEPAGWRPTASSDCRRQGEGWGLEGEGRGKGRPAVVEGAGDRGGAALVGRRLEVREGRGKGLVAAAGGRGGATIGGLGGGDWPGGRWLLERKEVEKNKQPTSIPMWETLTLTWDWVGQAHYTGVRR